MLELKSVARRLQTWGSGGSLLGQERHGAGTRRVRFGAVVIMALLSPMIAMAQIMSVEPDGAVTVYSGPAVFTDGGVAPIARPRPSAVPRGEVIVSADLENAAKRAALSPALVAAVAWRESNFRSDRVSRAGAIGEMQLMPATARQVRVDPTKPDENLRGGADYLRAMLNRYDGDLPRALAAYNAGPGAVDRHGAAAPFKETQAYVDAILDRLSHMAEATAPRAPGLQTRGGQ